MIFYVILRHFFVKIRRQLEWGVDDWVLVDSKTGSFPKGRACDFGGINMKT